MTVQISSTFDHHLLDAINCILKNFSFGDLVSIAKIDEQWRRLVARMINSKRFQRFWVEKQNVTENIVACYSGMGGSIRAVFGDTSRSVALLETFIERVMGKPNSYDGVSLMLSAFFAHEENDGLKQLASKVFKMVQRFRSFHNPLYFDKLECRKRDRTLYFFEASRRVQAYILGAVFHKEKARVNGNVLLLTGYVSCTLAPADECDWYPLYYREVLIRRPWDMKKLSPLAEFFRAVLDYSETDDQLEYLAKFFQAYCGYAGPSTISTKSAVVAMEPSLIRLFLHEKIYWITNFEVKSIIFMSIRNFDYLPMHERIGKLLEFEKALEKVKERNLREKNGRSHLKILCDGVRRECDRFSREVEPYSIAENPFYRSLLAILLQ